jgi:hypothetical protein
MNKRFLSFFYIVKNNMNCYFLAKNDAINNNKNSLISSVYIKLTFQMFMILSFF